MASTAAPRARTPAQARRGLARVFAGPRVRFTLAVAGGFGVLSGLHGDASVIAQVLRAWVIGGGMLFAFGLFETRPRWLPRWLSRTALRLAAVVAVIPLSSAFLAGLDWPARHSVGALTGAALLFGPWIAVAAILRQRDAVLREQAFAFELERSQYQQRESEARLRQLQAQVEPHFLFNTLANVQALVDAGSPQASPVLGHLIAYLRAAVPRMHSQHRRLGDEVDLVRAYFEIMQMRMPDRLQYAIHLDPALAHLPCPPMALLTLVENAVKHGIDPSETGGRIDVDIWARDGRCMLRVTDTGVGLTSVGHGLGTGLTTLRERLKLAYGSEARLTLGQIAPHGVCAEIVLPVHRDAA